MGRSFLKLFAEQHSEKLWGHCGAIVSDTCYPKTASIARNISNLCQKIRTFLTLVYAKLVFFLLLPLFFAFILQFSLEMVRPNVVEAASVYKNCTKQLFGTLPKSAKIGFIGKGCADKCENACKKAFGYLNYDEGIEKEKALFKKYSELYQDLKNPTTKEHILNLNFPAVVDCVATCRKGVKYTGKIYRYDPYQTIGNPYNIQIALEDYCYDLPENSNDFKRYEESFLPSFVDVGFNLKPNSSVTISIDNWRQQPETLLKEGKNELYTCGFKNINIFLDRNQDGAKQVEGFNYWTPKDHQWQDTGISVKQDDYLSINYLGRYRSNSNCNAGNAPSCINRSDYDLEIILDKPRSNDPVLDDKEFIRGSRIQNTILEYDIRDLEDKPEFQEQIREEDADYNKQYQQDMNEYKNKGLTNLIVTAADKPQLFLKDSAFDERGYSYNNQSFRNTKAEGRVKSQQLDGISESKKLYIRHPFRNAAKYSPIGGYDVSIGWRGCPIDGSKHLYFALVPDFLINGSYYYLNDTIFPKGVFDKAEIKSPGGVNQTIYHFLKRHAQWRPVVFDEAGNAIINYESDKDVEYAMAGIPKPDKGGPTEQPKSFRIFLSMARDLTNIQPWNTLGFYSLEFSQKAEDDKNGFFCDMLKNIFNIFQGDGKKKGLSEIIYTNILKDNSYLNVVRLLLVLYIALLAIGFLIGISRLSQGEALNSVLKVAFILLLISDKSWEMIYSNFLNIFIDGCRNLINIFTIRINEGITRSNYCGDLGLDIFNLFDETIKITLGSSDVFWKRILALFFSGLFGIVLSIFLLVAVLIYLLTIMRAIILYLLCFIFSAILIMSAPIFIPTILFKMTKSMFDGWLKNLIALTLQPVFVFAALSIFHELMLFMLKQALGFTLCMQDTTFLWIFNVNMPRTLFNYHMPNDLSAPMNDIAVIITFGILVQAMHALISTFSAMASRLISFATLSLGDSGFSQTIMSPISSATGTIGKVLGMDVQSSAKRMKERQPKK